MRISRYEQETIINFNAEEKLAVVYTADPAIIRRFRALIERRPDLVRATGDKGIGETFTLPKRLITVRVPRQLSEEQKKAASERLAATRKAKPEGGVDG